MTRLEIEVAEDLAERMGAAAAARGVAPAVLAGQVLAGSFPPRRRLAFIGMGHSKSGRRAAEDEEKLTEGFGTAGSPRS